MRLGVLDVGSNTVHLLVVDAHPGARPLPAHSHKAELRLAQLLDEAGAIGPEGVDKLVAVVHEALQAAEDKGVEDLLPFATSAVREASNADDVLARVQAETGVELQVLTGAEEARLTFLAARRWFGWSVGKLLVLDIGGGSLEIAYGMDEEPDAAVSLPLGAGRLTAGWLPGDPPDPEAVRALRRHVRAQIARTVGRVHPLRRPGPRRRHVEDVQAAGPPRRRGPLHGGPLRPARTEARVAGGLGPPARRHDRRPSGPNSPASRRAERASSSRAPWWPRARWTCSAWRRWKSARGR